MEKPLNLVLKLSLKEMALRRVVVKLWNEKDIFLSLNYLKSYKINDKQFKIEWQDNVECRVKDKVSKLELPESLKERMMQIVRPIGFEILRWISSTPETGVVPFEECFNMYILEQLCWTCTGAVDFQKTVENLVLHVISNVEKKYELACNYCLVDSIRPIWEELPENVKEAFYNETSFEDTTMKTYWTYFLKGEESKLNSLYNAQYDYSFYLRALKISVYDGNKAGTKYFSQRTTPLERNVFFYGFANVILSWQDEDREYPDGEYPDVVCCLLSHMSFQSQKTFFTMNPYAILRNFLDWPLQDLFLDIEDKIRQTLSEKYDYLELYKIVGDAVNWGYYFPNLMPELFLRIPSDFKRLFLSRFGYTIFEFADTKTIQVVFKNQDLDAREHFVSSFQFSEIIRNLITKDKWHIAEACLRALSLSEEEKKRLKDAFFGNLNDTTEMTSNQKWERVREFLDETEASARIETEDETLPSVKKLCTEEKKLSINKTI